jgi:hypothetical protein
MRNERSFSVVMVLCQRWCSLKRSQRWNTANASATAPRTFNLWHGLSPRAITLLILGATFNIVVVISVMASVLSAASHPRSQRPTIALPGTAQSTSSMLTPGATSSASSTPLPSCPDCAASAVVTFTNSYTTYSPSALVRVGIDSTAQIAAKQFTITLTAGAPDNLPAANDYTNSILATCPYQQPCFVPSTCASDPNTFNKADGMTGGRMQLKVENTIPPEYKLDAAIAFHRTYDHTSIVCLPGAGYSSQTSFVYYLSENATETLILFRPQEVIDYELALLKKTAPSGWVFAVAQVCAASAITASSLFNVTATSADVSCDARGTADYDWNAQARANLAGRMAGKTINAASTAAYQTEGVSAITDLQIKLSYGTRLPNDPSKIAFNVLPVPR